MAEGDTITRTKQRLAPIFLGYEVTGLHIANPGKWRGHRPRVGMAATNFRIATNQGIATCSKAKNIVGLSKAEAQRVMSRFGPDLIELHNLGDPQDSNNSQYELMIEKIVTKARTRLDQNIFIHEALMNQSIASGIGNIYKSEALHIQKLNPFVTLESLDDEQIANLYKKAAELLAANAQGRDAGKRRRTIVNRGRTGTESSSQFFVYGRNQLKCRRCDDSIRRSYKESGKASNAGKYQPRSTYWCDTCQR